MCENEIQIEIEKGNPKTIMNLNDKKNLINRDSVLSHQHCRIRLFFRRLYFIRHVKERQCRWQNWTTLKDGVCSWLSAAHSLRCFERKKKTGWKENGSTSGPKSDLFCLSAFACLELTYERVSQECYAQVVLLQ